MRVRVFSESECHLSILRESSVPSSRHLLLQKQRYSTGVCFSVVMTSHHRCGQPVRSAVGASCWSWIPFGVSEAHYVSGNGPLATLFGGTCGPRTSASFWPPHKGAKQDRHHLLDSWSLLWPQRGRREQQDTHGCSSRSRQCMWSGPLRPAPDPGPDTCCPSPQGLTCGILKTLPLVPRTLNMRVSVGGSPSTCELLALEGPENSWEVSSKGNCL